MTPTKRVAFIERVDKTVLGLDGLEIVVESDRNCRGIEETKVEFAKLGKEILNKIDGEYVMNKYPNMKPGLDLKGKIHEERVIYCPSSR